MASRILSIEELKIVRRLQKEESLDLHLLVSEIIEDYDVVEYVGIYPHFATPNSLFTVTINNDLYAVLPKNEYKNTTSFQFPVESQELVTFSEEITKECTLFNKEFIILKEDK